MTPTLGGKTEVVRLRTEKLVKPGIVIGVLLVSLLMCGCGGGSSSSSGSYSSITSGNWSLTGTSTVTSGLVLSIGGSLTQSDNVVSGVLYVSSYDSSCSSLSGSAIPFTGKFDGDKLTLVSDEFSSQSVTVNATGSGSSLTGTYSVAGGCADGDSGTIVASYLPPINGTWSGTLTNPDGTPIPINPNNLSEGAEFATVTLTQSATATNGRFPLSGTFNFNFSSSCFSSGTVPGTTAAYVMGSTVVISATGTDGTEFVYGGGLEKVPASSAKVTVIGGRFMGFVECAPLLTLY